MNCFTACLHMLRPHHEQSGENAALLSLLKVCASLEPSGSDSFANPAVTAVAILRDHDAEEHTLLRMQAFLAPVEINWSRGMR